MVIETNLIREPEGGRTPDLLMVPFQMDPPANGHDHAGAREEKPKAKGHEEGPKGQDGQAKKDKPDDNQDRDDDRGQSKDQRKDAHGRQAQTPSLARSLMVSGVVALICGLAGAWGYSYFFGPSKSDDQKSSSKKSDSSKSSDKGSGSSSSKSSDSSDSDSSKNTSSSNTGANSGSKA